MVKAPFIIFSQSSESEETMEVVETENQNEPPENCSTSSNTMLNFFDGPVYDVPMPNAVSSSIDCHSAVCSRKLERYFKKGCKNVNFCTMAI